MEGWRDGYEIDGMEWMWGGDGRGLGDVVWARCEDDVKKMDIK